MSNRDRFAQDLADVKFVAEPTPTAIRIHGELGPVLVDPAHEFTGPDDLKPSGPNGNNERDTN